MKHRKWIKLLSALSLISLCLPAWSWQAARRAQGKRQVEVKLIEQQVSTTNSSSYDFTVNLPAPSDGRVILIAAYGLRNGVWRTVDGITINGVSATYTYGLGMPLYFYQLNDDTLSGSQTITVNYSNNLDRSGLAVLEVYGWGGLGADENKYENTEDSSRTYNWSSLPKGSKVLCLAYNFAPNDIVWTNATEIFDVSIESSDQASIGMLDVTATGAQTLTVASAGGAMSVALVLQSK